MKPIRTGRASSLPNKVAWIVAIGSLAVASTYPCTIFVIRDAQHALFCNNEDWSNPRTKIWFLPGEGKHGCAYVGFNNGWAQGGLNTEGVAFDWVAGYKEKWEPDPKLQPVKGNPAQRMLETCASVQEAIAFFQTHWEPSFSYAKILIGDRTGESVVVGAKDGQLTIERRNDSRALGYRGELAQTMLIRNPEATISNAATILRAAVQEGQYATKYSNVFDLKTGDIYIYRFLEQPEGIKLSLTEQLKKGRHYYDIPQLKEQLKSQ